MLKGDGLSQYFVVQLIRWEHTECYQLIKTVSKLDSEKKQKNTLNLVIWYTLQLLTAAGFPSFDIIVDFQIPILAQ